MKKENKYILEIIKGEKTNANALTKLMKGNLDYPYILGQLLFNRVGAIAYFTLKQNGLLQKVNREFRSSLKTIYEYNLIRTDSFCKALQSLGEIFREIDFPYAFLKGAYLVQLYPRGLRTSNDIDILINPNNITELTNILKKHEFKQGNIKNELFVPADRKEIVFSRMNRGETVPFVKEVNMPGMKYLEIDINFSLGFRPGMDESIVRAFLDRTQPLILGEIATLDNIDFFLHLCAHLYKEATVMSWVEMGRDISLYKHIDICMYLNHQLNEYDFRKMIQRIKEVELQKECYFAVFYTKQLFNDLNPYVDMLLEEIRPEDLSFMKQIIDLPKRKKYFFDIDYNDWVFCSNRKGTLYEARNAGE